MSDAETPSDTQAFTVRLPKDLYEQLRRDAFDQHTSMNALIAEELGRRYERADRRRAGKLPFSTPYSKDDLERLGDAIATLRIAGINTADTYADVLVLLDALHGGDPDIEITGYGRNAKIVKKKDVNGAQEQ